MPSPFPLTTLRAETVRTGRLALPLVVGQLAQVLIGLSDTLMVGQLGVTPLAACSLANTMLYLPMMFGIGISMAVAIRVSHARGAGDSALARASLRDGLYLTLALGVLTLLLALLTWSLLPALAAGGDETGQRFTIRQDPAAVAAMPVYLLIAAASCIPAFGSMAVKNHADAMNRPWPVFWISIGGVLLNIALNWVLIFGKLGAPALGLEGAGIATLIARLASLIGMIAWCRADRGLRDWVPKRWLRPPDWRAIRGLLRTGIPASLQLVAEVSAFIAATFLIGAMGAAALAAHQVALQCAAFVFMVPVGLSMALTVRIGAANGAGNRAAMRPILLSGWLMGIAFTLVSATSFLAFNHTISGWFIADPAVHRIAAGLLLIAAAFQFCDSMQILSAGALRGLDDVHVPALVAMVAYWLVAIPAGWLLAHPGGQGVGGMWWGITLGLTLTALVLGRRAWRRTGENAPREGRNPE